MLIHMELTRAAVVQHLVLEVQQRDCCIKKHMKLKCKSVAKGITYPIPASEMSTSQFLNSSSLKDG